jgi:hypothetical protein
MKSNENESQLRIAVFSALNPGKILVIIEHGLAFFIGMFFAFNVMLIFDYNNHLALKFWLCFAFSILFGFAGSYGVWVNGGNSLFLWRFFNVAPEQIKKYKQNRILMMQKTISSNNEQIGKKREEIDKMQKENDQLEVAIIQSSFD